MNIFVNINDIQPIHQSFGHYSANHSGSVFLSTVAGRLHISLVYDRGLLSLEPHGVDDLHGQSYQSNMSQPSNNPPSNKQGVGTSGTRAFLLVDAEHFHHNDHMPLVSYYSLLIDLVDPNSPAWCINKSFLLVV